MHFHTQLFEAHKLMQLALSLFLSHSLNNEETH